MIIATATAPYVEPTISKGEICIEDDVPEYIAFGIDYDQLLPEYIAFGIDYDQLFPAGHKYGKDGEIINMDLLPGPIKHDPTATPDGHNDHPVMP